MTPTLLDPGRGSAAAPTQAPDRPKRGHAVAPTTERRHWGEKPSGRPDPAGHLSPEQIDALGRELDALRQEVMDSRGSHDAAYIRRVIATQRGIEAVSRLVLLFSKHPSAWVLGTAGLSVAKILENMEIGHNVLHGQWDWMRDPKIHSTTWEWDHVGPASMWKRSHNELHHTFTNVIGMDDDLGYGIMRVDVDQPWEPLHLLQPLTHTLNALTFQFGIAFYDLELRQNLARWGELDEQQKESFLADVKATAAKIARHVLRDYVLHPVLSGPSAVTTLQANLVANCLRNVWTNAIIICGHFPDGVQTFEIETIEGESRGEWYLRQMLGSANISGGPLVHLMSGNLSHQIEHHMFPDVPSNRYAQIAPRVRALMQENGLHYVTGPLPVQLASVTRKVFSLSLPNGAWADLRERPLATLRRGASWLTSRGPARRR
ncbi:fatty acid desaturase family protein [Gephyromycinifex aptenodytis]|uniref:fatty acid desaturase family protein n=1 Tax=Gephyromycinifex aptenodytis TaxID=2716227 RepID=UPI001445C8D6|nr:acyl-CoA desaturase [Gephyromycinifex aptenodytis]